MHCRQRSKVCVSFFLVKSKQKEMKTLVHKTWIENFRVFNFKHQLKFRGWLSVHKRNFFSLSRAAFSKFLSRIISVCFHFDQRFPFHQQTIGNVETSGTNFFAPKKSLIGRNHLTTNNVFPLIKILFCFKKETNVFYRCTRAQHTHEWDDPFSSL